MKYAIISDVHNRTWIAETLASRFEKEGYTVIFLGDYFDNFEDTPEDAEKTAQWLKRSLYQPNRIHLLGNHDAAYIFRHNTAANCPGGNHEKNSRVWKVLNNRDFEKVKLYHYVEDGNWLLSHAGFTLPNLFGFKFHEFTRQANKYSHLKKLTRAELLEYLAKETKKFFELTHNNHYHHFLFQGSRMGELGNGGPFWLHWMDFHPIKQFNQIVGHTNFKTPYSCLFPNQAQVVSTNWCIDTHNDHVAFIEDGVFSFKKSTDFLDL